MLELLVDIDVVVRLVPGDEAVDRQKLAQPTTHVIRELDAELDGLGRRNRMTHLPGRVVRAEPVREIDKCVSLRLFGRDERSGRAEHCLLG